VEKKKVLVIGGGFGGVFAAKKLARRGRDKFDVELINNNNYFVFQPLLPEVAPPPSTPRAVAPLRPVAARHRRFARPKSLLLLISSTSNLSRPRRASSWREHAAKPPPMTRTFFFSTGENPCRCDTCRHTYARSEPRSQKSEVRTRKSRTRRPLLSGFPIPISDF